MYTIKNLVSVPRLNFSRIIEQDSIPFFESSAEYLAFAADLARAGAWIPSQQGEATEVSAELFEEGRESMRSFFEALPEMTRVIVDDDGAERTVTIPAGALAEYYDSIIDADDLPEKMLVVVSGNRRTLAYVGAHYICANVLRRHMAARIPLDIVALPGSEESQEWKRAFREINERENVVGNIGRRELNDLEKLQIAQSYPVRSERYLGDRLGANRGLQQKLNRLLTIDALHEEKFVPEIVKGGLKAYKGLDKERAADALGRPDNKGNRQQRLWTFEELKQWVKLGAGFKTSEEIEANRAATQTAEQTAKESIKLNDLKDAKNTLVSAIANAVTSSDNARLEQINSASYAVPINALYRALESESRIELIIAGVPVYIRDGTVLSGETETNEPATVEPETNEPETNEPATVEPETNEPETNEPATVEPAKGKGKGKGK